MNFLSIFSLASLYPLLRFSILAGLCLLALNLLVRLLPAFVMAFATYFLMTWLMSTTKDNAPQFLPVTFCKNVIVLNEAAIKILMGLFVAGISAAFIFYKLADGFEELSTNFFSGLLQIGAFGMLACGWFLTVKFFSEKESVMDMFSISTDPVALRDFLSGQQTASIQIDPVMLEEHIKKEVIGQDRVARELARQVWRSARMNRPGKPLGVFLLVGPTGVGKTEMAKAVAEGAFEGRLVRFDMNQFTESHSSQSLIGSPAGYQGAENGGQLTQSIFTNKSGVLLFDEIEKAHPDVNKMLMTLTDEGRITEMSTGRVADASKFIIIFTSNARSEELARLAQTISDPQDLTRAVKDCLLTEFAKEQLSRIDAVFCFNKLDRFSTAAVINKFLMKFARDAGVELILCDPALLIDTILKHEKQSDYGIRELVRLIEKTVVDGMYDCRDAGYKRVGIVAYGDIIKVRGIDDDDYGHAETQAARTMSAGR